MELMHRVMAAVEAADMRLAMAETAVGDMPAYPGINIGMGLQILINLQT